MRRSPVAVILVALLVAAAAIVHSCTAPPGRQAQTELLFFAAASTTDAVREVAAAFEAEHAVRVHCNFASSATLAQQILAGAEADLFLSAHPEWVDVVEAAGSVERKTEFLGNALVVIVPSAAGSTLRDPAGLLSDTVQLVSIGEPTSVPAGMYAREALEKLGLWPALQPKLVSALDVRQVLTFVETGEVDAGIVYATDAAVSRNVAIAAHLDSGLTGPIRYPLVLLAGRPDKAAALFRFIGSEAARETFRRKGFLLLDER